MTANGNALELHNISSGYGQTTVLRDVSLVVKPGSVTALLGPNGAGKTTLLRTISGGLRPTSGTISMFDQEVTRLSSYKRSRLGMCHIPEGRGVFRSLTVQENLSMQALPGKEAESIERAAEVFPILGVRLKQTAGTLSGGQQQMLAMARAYIREPSLILVDEASLGLAPLVVEAIFGFLQKLADGGAALVIVDQFVARALEMASDAYLLNKGRITFSGSAADLRGRDVFEEYLSQGSTEVATG
jgi:branched-chain amino acid transport system ATP-binding protein